MLVYLRTIIIFTNCFQYSRLKEQLGIILCITSLLFAVSCKKDAETICENLSKEGMAGSTLLIGEWEFENFGKTVNGKKIKTKETIEKGHLNFFSADSVWLRYTNEILFTYSLDNSNSIFAVLNIQTEINAPEEEASISNAFENACCYVIKDDKLLIYYKQEDRRNVLVLKKK